VKTVRLAISALEANVFIPQLALDAGLYKKYGLDVTITVFEGSQKTLQAVIAGQVDGSTDAPQSTLTSMTSESPELDVAIFTNKFLDCIVTKSNIVSAADLKGKRMAVSQLGGQSHAEDLVALKSLGLTGGDVNIVQIGGQGARVAALQAGSVDAVPVDCVKAKELVGQGFKILVSLPDVAIPFAGANLTFKRSFVDQNPNTVLAITAANLEAMQLLWTDENTAVKAFAAWAQVPEAAALTTLEGFKAVAQRDLRSTEQAYANVRDVQVLTNPDVANVDVTKAYDWKFLDQLATLGLYKQLGVPGS
jgi:NitT/TauT family transport system substrate-binding protein